MLSINNLNVFRGKTHVLQDVSFEVREGEIFSLVGSNGAGKTTLLMALSGIISIKSGTAVLGSGPDAVDIVNSRPETMVRAGLVHCPEGRQVVARMTVEENLRLGAYLDNNPARIAAHMEQAFEMFPVLRERRATAAGGMSGGEQMMLALARALMASPKILLLDEPSLGLAPRITEQIFETLDDINRKQGVTIVLVEQNAMMAFELASRGCVLVNGRLDKVSDAADLLRDPQIVASYLGVGQ